MSEAAEFEIIQDDCVVASVSGPRDSAVRGILNYAAQYAQDSPITIYEVTRREISIETLLTPLAAQGQDLGGCCDLAFRKDAPCCKAFTQGAPSRRFCATPMPDNRLCGHLPECHGGGV